MRTRFAWVAAGVLVCMIASATHATNQVTVVSKSIGANAADVAVPVLLENDIEMTTIVVPFVIREVTPGAYITGLRLSWGDRLVQGPGQPLNDVRITNIYADPDGGCGVGGFATRTSGDLLKHDVIASPEGAMFAALRLFNLTLLPGADVMGSLILNVDVTGTLGTFEVDTV